MKKYFVLYEVVEKKTVCIPSDSYYRKSNEWDEDTVYQTLKFITKDEEEKHLLEYLDSMINEYSGQYVILPIYELL